MSEPKNLKPSSQIVKSVKSPPRTEPAPVLFAGTGSDTLDLTVGGGIGPGYPYGRIINVVGDKSTGKTFLACELIAGAYHKDPKHFKWSYDDCESGFTHDTKALYGIQIIPLDPKERRRSKTVEDLFGNVRTFSESLKPDEYGIYVTDSLDGLVSEEGQKRAEARFKAFTNETEYKEGSYMMGKAKFLSQEFFPQIAEYIETTKVLLVIVSQVRDNIDAGMFEAKFVRAGGKAMDFYCHTVLWLATGPKISRKDRAVGAVVRAKTTKSKTPRPFRECNFSFLFDYGLDNTGTNIDYLFDLRGDSLALTKDAQSIVWKGEPSNFENLKAFLIENDKWEDFKGQYKSQKKSDMEVYLEASPLLSPAYIERFGVPRTRDELVAYIEDNKLQKELTTRVQAKWEAVEESIRTKRVSKYGGE